MSDAMVQTVFWLAFVGLALALSGLGALLRFERQRLRLSLRLRRAVGGGTGAGTSGGRGIAQGGPQSGSIAHLRAQVLLLIARLGDRLSVISGGEARETAAHLSSAGYRGRDALLIYAFLKTVLPLVSVVTGMAWVLLSEGIGMGMVLPSAKAIGFALLLSKAVDFVVNNKRKKRMATIRRGFPDMLELLVISSEAGLGPQPALQRVALELASTNSELAQEILQMVSEMRMTNDRRAAYEKLKIRVPLPEIGIFTQTLDQSDTYGTPFSRSVRTLITEQRANRLFAVEEKAARLPVIMTIPLIFCIMAELKTLGPVSVFMSGNGWHIYFPIETLEGAALGPSAGALAAVFAQIGADTFRGRPGPACLRTRTTFTL